MTYHCRIVRLVPNALLRIEVKPVGLRIVNVYEVAPIDGGSRIRHAFEISGPMSGPLRWIGVARAYQSSLEDEIRHCVEMAKTQNDLPARPRS